MDVASSDSGRSSGGTGVTPRRLTEFLVAGVVACAAIAVGIYLGFTTAMTTASSERLLQSLNQSYLDVGDPFPDYALWDDETQTSVSVRLIAPGHPALLLFLSRSCGACHAMSDYWEQRVTPMLRGDLAMVTIYDDGDWYGDSTRLSEARLFPMAKLLTTDRETQREHDGITSTPTLVALKPDGRIALIASGFSRHVTAELINGLW